MAASSRTAGSTGSRVLCGARGAYGLALVLVPQRAARLVGASHEAPIVRLLGVRHLLQAGWTASGGGRARLRDGALIDAAHSLSMVALAVISPPARRSAANDAVIAAGWAIAGARLARPLFSA